MTNTSRRDIRTGADLSGVLFRSSDELLDELEADDQPTAARAAELRAELIRRGYRAL